MSAASSITSDSRRTAIIRGATYFGVWTVIALVTTELQLAGQPASKVTYWKILPMGLASCWLWAAFTPLILGFARLVRIDKSNWPRTIPLHLIAAASFTIIDVMIMHAIAPWLNPSAATLRTPLHIMFVRNFFLYAVCYFAIVALAHVRYYASLSYERDLRAAQLEGQLSAARLTALQGQLRPHFLFNTLNMIAEQVHTDPDGADAMLTRLGVLLRSSFVEADRERVPLHRELELLDSYIGIMQARFRGRLDFEREVDPAALDALVPRFIFQPLVENAIKHGVEPREEGGVVTVVARRAGDSLALEVRDNGDGLAGSLREGTGVRNTRERLLHLYGAGRQQFALSPSRDGGTVASVLIPFETEEDEPPPTFTVPHQPEAQNATRGVRHVAPPPAVFPRSVP